MRTGKRDTHPGSIVRHAGIFSHVRCGLFSVNPPALPCFPNGLHHLWPIVCFFADLRYIAKPTKTYKSTYSQTSFTIMVMKMGQHRQASNPYLKEEQRPDPVSFILFICMLHHGSTSTPRSKCYFENVDLPARRLDPSQPSRTTSADATMSQPKPFPCQACWNKASLLQRVKLKHGS